MAKNRLLIIALVLGLVLRLVRLDQSFWLDEASQAQLSSLSVSQIWSGRGGDFHPPLFYLVAHFWLSFGRSEAWLRLPSVAFGVANIALVYLIALRLFPNLRLRVRATWVTAADLAAWLLAVNPYHVYYSQEFRSYSLLALLGTGSMSLFFNRKWLWLGVINALLLYTHYSAAFLLLAQVIYVAGFVRRDLMSYAKHLVAVFVLYLPWLPQFWYQFTVGVAVDRYLPGWGQILTVSPVKSLPLFLFKYIAGRVNLTSPAAYLVYIVFVLAVCGGALAATRHQRRFLYSWFLAPLLFSLIMSLAVPQTQPFRLIFILPALILLFAQACVRFPRLFVTFFVYIAIFGNVLYFTRVRLQREQWRQAVAYLNLRPAPTVVAWSDRFAPLRWYPVTFSVVPAVPTFPAKAEQVSAALSSAALPARIYYLEYLSALSDPTGLVRQTLVNLGYRQTALLDFAGVGFIYEYQKT